MAFIDDATLVVATGRFYTANIGTPNPTDLSAIPAAWEDMGHTSLEDVMSLSSEGGEQTTLGTLQAPQHRTRHSPRSETFGITLQQFDEGSLKLYYGSNANTSDAGNVRVPTNPVPTRKAFLAVLQDGERRMAIYAPLAEIFRSDNIDISDTESLASLPINVKPMQHGSNDWLYETTPLGAPVADDGE